MPKACRILERGIEARPFERSNLHCRRIGDYRTGKTLSTAILLCLTVGGVDVVAFGNNLGRAICLFSGTQTGDSKLFWPKLCLRPSPPTVRMRRNDTTPFDLAVRGPLDRGRRSLALVDEAKAGRHGGICTCEFPTIP